MLTGSNLRTTDGKSTKNLEDKLKELENKIDVMFQSSKHINGYDNSQIASMTFVAILSFGLSITGHVANTCMSYSSEILVTTSSLYAASWVIIGFISWQHASYVEFCSKQQRKNRCNFTISAYASLGCSLLMYDAYTAVGGAIMVFFAVLQVIVTMFLFVIVLMHGHSPRCLAHTFPEDEILKPKSQGYCPSCGSGNILGKVIGSLLVVFIILQFLLIAFAIAFNYTLKETPGRPPGCAVL